MYVTRNISVSICVERNWRSTCDKYCEAAHGGWKENPRSILQLPYNHTPSQCHHHHQLQISLACVIKLKAQSFLEEVPGGIKKRATTRAPAPPGLTSQLSSPSLLRRQIYWQQTPTSCPSIEPCLARQLISFKANNILTKTKGIRHCADCQCYI